MSEESRIVLNIRPRWKRLPFCYRNFRHMLACGVGVYHALRGSWFTLTYVSPKRNV